MYEVAVFRLTVDLECHEDPPSHAYLKTIHQLLDRLDEQRVRATFFVNGTALASESGRQSVKEISIRGHEIGSHGYLHRFLRTFDSSSFADDLKKSREIIATTTGMLPTGYRAPYFSMTPDVLWAPEAIVSAGFDYSSSVLPAYNPQCGLPGAPRTPFVWACGLTEFPVPVIGFGNFRFPLLGGGYFRLTPTFLVSIARRRLLRDGDSWSYLHPYDLSTEIAFHSPQKSSWWMRPLIGFNRKNSLESYLRLLTPTVSTFSDLSTDRSYVSTLPIVSSDSLNS